MHGQQPHRGDTARGAAVLRRLQSTLPARLHQPPDSACVFLQVQLLQRGARITPHVDAPTPPADLVASLALGEAGGTVGVGDVLLSLQPGDLYAICGEARWQASHEMRSSRRDRLSVTLRYASERL